MTGLEFLGFVMLVVMLFAIFIGLPISFTLLFLALMFGYVGLGVRVFNLTYLQTFGLMKQDEFVAVPLFILMGYVCDQGGLMERLFTAFRNLFAPVRGSSCTRASSARRRSGPRTRRRSRSSTRRTWRASRSC